MAGPDGLREVRAAHAGLLTDSAGPGALRAIAGVRDIVADSWMRSVAAGVNVDASLPLITLDQDLLGDYRAEHPLSQIYPLLYDVLGRAAEDCDSVMAVADAQGQLLWVCGRPAVLRRAEEILFVEGLGRPDCVVSVGARTFRLSPRHSEIMVILAGRPDGLSGDELALLLYPDDVTSSTPRAELVRLRALLGDDLLASRPYRLTCEVKSDWAAVAAQLVAGNVAEAVRLYRGPLLPHSQAPGVAEQREDLQRWLRGAIMADGAADLLVSWTRTRWGADDLQMWQRQCAVLPVGSPLRAMARAAVAKLDAQFGR
jgi:hypothetical protein